MLKNNEFKYGAVAKIFHWTLAILIIAMLILGFLMGEAADTVIKGRLYNLHKLLGLLILLLMLLRALWAASNIKPVLYFTNLLEKFLERIVHYALYVTLILMPISGWVMSSAAGHPPMLNGVALALPIAESKPVAKTAAFFHYWLAITIITLLIIHIAAAFVHHFIKKDDVLRRMLP